MRNRRSTRTSISTCRPGTNSASQVGRVDSRSMTPKKLRAYTSGFCTHTRRSTYSTVNSAVNTHSATPKKSPNAACMLGMLSSTTMTTLATMVSSGAWSNQRPGRVSASKMMVSSVSRQPLRGLPSWCSGLLAARAAGWFTGSGSWVGYDYLQLSPSRGAVPRQPARAFTAMMRGCPAEGRSKAYISGGVMNPLASSLLAAVQLSQATRLLQLDTALAGATLLVERATLTESLHALEPLRAEVDCVSTEAGLPLKSLMGTRVALRLLQADGSWRTWQGWVAAVAQLGSDGGLGRYRLTVRDGSCWLALRRDTRIFQDLTTADIVSQVLQAWPQLPFRLDVAEAGPLRAITTQHRETDWAFACRLMAAEGWSWRLDHTAAPDAGPQLVVFDQAAELPDLGGLRCPQPGRHGAAGTLLGQLAGNLFGGFAQDTLTEWATSQAVGPNAVTLGAWDERQLAGVAAQAQSERPAGVPPLEFYRGHGERQHANGRVADALHASPAEAEGGTQDLLDALALQQQGIDAAGAVRALHPGRAGRRDPARHRRRTGQLPQPLQRRARQLAPAAPANGLRGPCCTGPANRLGHDPGRRPHPRRPRWPCAHPVCVAARRAPAGWRTPRAQHTCWRLHRPCARRRHQRHLGARGPRRGRPRLGCAVHAPPRLRGAGRLHRR